MPVAKLAIDFKGLATAPGELVQAPGALTTAVNFNFPAPGRAEPRRAFGKGTEPIAGSCWSIISTKQLGANIIVSNGGTTGSTEVQYGDLTVPLTTLATPDAALPACPPEARMKAAVSLRNHYLTSSRATLCVEPGPTLRYAGMPRAPGIHWRQQNATQLVAGTWLPNGYAVAYRVVWVRPDGGTNALIQSTPSGRWVVANVATTAGHTGAARAVTLNVGVPFQSDTDATAINTTWRMQLYRSQAVNTASAQPDDEMQLCYEASPTAGEITAGYMTLTDVCPESGLGAFLYTNSVLGGDVTGGSVRPQGTSLGMAAANDRPPIAKDIAMFADCLWYANIVTPARFQFSILGTGAGALAVGDVLTIDTIGFTGVAGAPVAATDFRVETGLGSVTLNIRQTAMNLVAAINTGHPNLAAAYIGSDASPGTIGSILLEQRVSNAVSFSVSTSGIATAFLPSLTGGAGSSADGWENGLAVSKPFQGDAVPPANYWQVGRSDAVIQRVIPLRDALYIFTDDGIYWARGSLPADFAIEKFDGTFRLAARESCVAIGDAIYAWGLEGIARITNGGVEYLDLPVRNLSLALVTVGGADFATSAFAVAYPTQRRVLFFYRLGDEEDYSCARALVWNLATETWSEMLLASETVNGRLSGAVRWSDERLVMGQYSASGADTVLFVEEASLAGQYLDTCWDPDTAEATQQTIIRQIEWAAVTPNPSTLCHWSEVQLYSESSITAEVVYAVYLGVTTDLGESDGRFINCLGDFDGTFYRMPGQQRMLLGSGVGFATRQKVTLADIGPVPRTYSGMALIYTPASPFVIR